MRGLNIAIDYLTGSVLCETLLQGWTPRAFVVQCLINTFVQCICCMNLEWLICFKILSTGVTSQLSQFGD